MSKRVLHILSQRPLLTGSGITLDALVRLAERNGWDQHVIVGVPHRENPVEVAGLPHDRIHPLYFENGELDFRVPGMSDVMPYPSTRFAAMTSEQIAVYKRAWLNHIQEVAARIKPRLVHSHHVWIMSSLLKQALPQTPVITHCHATGLRQMELAPTLKKDVVRGLKKNDRFLVLREDDGQALAEVLGARRKDIRLVGAGYNESVFHPMERNAVSNRIIYVGKLSKAKGLPWLLDAVEELLPSRPDLELQVVGSGAGPETAAIKQRIDAMSPVVKHWGQLPQTKLASLLRASAICVLPSFYEGVPLVLVEAMACGCRLIATSLKGVMSELKPHLGEALDIVPLPPLIGIDKIDPQGERDFVQNLKTAIEKSLQKPPLDVTSRGFTESLGSFSWNAVFERVETVWNELVVPDIDDIRDR